MNDDELFLRALERSDTVSFAIQRAACGKGTPLILEDFKKLGVTAGAICTANLKAAAKLLVESKSSEIYRLYATLLTPTDGRPLDKPTLDQVRRDIPIMRQTLDNMTKDKSAMATEGSLYVNISQQQNGAFAYYKSLDEAQAAGVANPVEVTKAALFDHGFGEPFRYPAGTFKTDLGKMSEEQFKALVNDCVTKADGRKFSTCRAAGTIAGERMRAALNFQVSDIAAPPITVGAMAPASGTGVPPR